MTVENETTSSETLVNNSLLNENLQNEVKPTISPPLSPDGNGKDLPKKQDQIANAVNSVLNGE